MIKGLIVIGYQGVGKTSMTSVEDGIIDLESSNFKIKDGTRTENWFEIYVRIAVNLAKQGFTVCISSHPCVCKELTKHVDDELFDIIAVYPDIQLKDEWIERLKQRFERDPSEKNEAAYLNAKEKFDENIGILYTWPFDSLALHSINYDLKDILIEMYAI